MDMRPLPGVDTVHDLNCVPYPFEASSFTEIRANHVLEHVPDLMPVMEELWRICAPGALLHIRVPHYTGALAWRDPTHVRSFTSESFGYFGENAYSFYARARFSVVRVSLIYRADRLRRSWLTRFAHRRIQALIDSHPTFGERNLAYMIGGIDEIAVTLKTVK